MRRFILLLLLFIAGCKNGDQETKTPEIHPTPSSAPGKMVDARVDSNFVDLEKTNPPVRNDPKAKTYSNERFKEVEVSPLGENSFKIQGKAQIFEASFRWVVDDGHDEIKSGFAMTDEGAPKWGRFKFVVQVKKKRPSSTLHLILYETSAKDGSRKFQLPILLH